MSGILGQDIKVDFVNSDILFGLTNDFKLISDDNNLDQAIKLRLLTQSGTMLQHSTYGSDLPSLKGEPHNEETLSLAILYTYAALTFEPRIDTVLDVSAEYVDDDLNISVSVQPIGSQNILNIIVTVI